MFIRTTALAIASIITPLLCFADAREEAQVTVSDLAWMTGTWSGSYGEQQTLEEHWSQPRGGSLACLVRITGDDGTAMMELLWIEEVDDSLRLRVGQWFPGFVPRNPEPQTMVLESIGDRAVTFAGTGNSDFTRLSYSSPSADEFRIDADTRTGERLQIVLNRFAL